jgi:plastocyanin
VWLVVSLPLAALVMVASAPRAQAASTVSVEISNFAFQPATVTIQVGDTVTWTNLDSAPHTATDTASSPLFDGVMSTGQSFSYTFTRAGTIDYFCTYHPEMTGTVIVQSEVPDAAMPLPSAWAATVLGVALLVLSLLVAVGGAGPRRPAARR